jgi:hypothetical protein
VARKTGVPIQSSTGNFRRRQAKKPLTEVITLTRKIGLKTLTLG